MEYPIDDARFIFAKEIACNLNVFVDHNSHRHVRPFEQFKHGSPQNGTQCGIDANKTPALGKLLINLRVDIALAPQTSYVLRVVGDDGELHYGVIRIEMLGFDQDDDPLMIFDWAYQLQAGNPELTPGRGG